jgi:hypothetical protein
MRRQPHATADRGFARGRGGSWTGIGRAHHPGYGRLSHGLICPEPRTRYLKLVS